MPRVVATLEMGVVCHDASFLFYKRKDDSAQGELLLYYSRILLQNRFGYFERCLFQRKPREWQSIFHLGCFILREGGSQKDT